MNVSESVAKLLPALIAAQKEFEPALKKVENQHFGSKYADLQIVIDATRPALNKNSLIIVQAPKGLIGDQSVTVITRLMHESGEFIEEELTLPAATPARWNKKLNREEPAQYNSQSVGSAITYARRYSYMAILGIAPEDDDANAASGHEEGKQELQRKSEKVNGSAPPIFEEDGTPVIQRQPVQSIQRPKQANGGAMVGIPRGKRFFAIAMGAGKTKDQINDYLGGIGCEKSEEIPVKQYEEACSWAAGR